MTKIEKINNEDKDTVSKKYVSIKLPAEYYGEKLDSDLKRKPQFRSRAELVKEIIRIYYENHE